MALQTGVTLLKSSAMTPRKNATRLFMFLVYVTSIGILPKEKVLKMQKPQLLK